MKRNELLAKSLTLGLAVATAATSMSVPGGLLAPQTAYAADADENSEETPKLSENNLKDNFKLAFPVVTVKTSNETVTPVAGAVVDYVKNVTTEEAKTLYGELTVTYKDAGGTNEVKGADFKVGDKYTVYMNITGGTALAAAAEPVKLGEVTVYEDLGDNAALTYKDGADDATGVTDLIGKEFKNDVVIGVSDDAAISTDANVGSENSVTISRENIASGSITVVLYVKKGDITYAKIVELKFAQKETDTTAPEITEIKNALVDGDTQTTSPLTDTTAAIAITPNEDGVIYAVWGDKEQTNLSKETIAVDNNKKVYYAKANQINVFKLIELTPNTTYYVYAVAADNAGNLSEVKEFSFTTLEAQKEEITGTVSIKDDKDAEISKLTVGDTIKAKYENGNATDAKYQWYRVPAEGEAEAIEGATEETYTVATDDLGYTLKVVVSDADLSGTKDAVTTTTVEKKEYEGTAPSFGDVTGADAEKAIKINVPDGAKLEYKLGDADWTDLTGDSITLGNKSYVAKAIQVRVKETEDTKAGEAVTYDKEIKATLEGTVAISGTMKYDETITAEVTGAQEGAALSYKFIRVTPATEEQGQATENAIDGTTGSTYKLTKEDIGSTIKVEVTADNYAGEITSAETGTIAKADARVVDPIEIESKTQSGETYTYTLKALDGADAQYAVKKADAEDDLDWKTSASFENLDPNTKYVFYATYKSNDCYEDSTAQTLEVTTDKLKHEALSLKVTVANKEGSEGTKTVTIEKVDGAEYSFDGGETYSETNTKDFVVADATEPITVAIRYPQDEKYEDVTPITQTFDLNKEMQEAPSAATLKVEVNADKTAYEIKVTAPSVSEGEVLEYSTDGVTYGELSAIKTSGLAANTSFTLYVRKAATEDKNASAGVAATATTPAASAAPTITGETKFKDKTSVTITGTGDVYYTTDGTAPTTASTKYAGAIEVSATTTIKAIAVETDKIMSAVSSETFTKETSGGNTSGGSTSGGSSSSGGGSATTPSKDDTKKDDNSKTETKPDGTKVTTTETKAEDGSVQTKIELKNDTTGVDATVNVAKDAQGKVTGATADVIQKSSDNKTAISAATVAQITEAAGTKDVEITTKTVDAQGQTVREVTVNASDLTAGKKLKVVMVDPKTGEKTLVNKTTYKVAADGSLALNNLGDGSYEVVTTAELNALTKEILKTVKPDKTKKNVTVGKKTKFTLDDELNMDNVAKITYKTGKKSVATVNANGTITAKKAGKVTIKAVVTLNNGKKKTIKMTITVKKKK